MNTNWNDLYVAEVLKAQSGAGFAIKGGEGFCRIKKVFEDCSHAFHIEREGAFFLVGPIAGKEIFFDVVLQQDELCIDIRQGDVRSGP